MKAQLLDIFKRNIGILVIGTLFLIFWFGGCGKDNGNQPQNTSDTVRVTTQVLQPMIINPPYQPQQQGNTVFPINIPAQYNPSGDIAKLTAQYEELVRNYLSIKRYADSITLKDTAGNRVGVVNLNQTVSENTLKETQSSYQLYFPKTVTTITNTIYPKIKNQWFIGGLASSTTGNPNINLGLGLLLKNKKENVLQLGAGYNLTTKQPQVYLGYYQKIRLGKK